MNNIKTNDETYIAAKAILEGQTYASLEEATIANVSQLDEASDDDDDDYNSLKNLFNGALIKAKSKFVQSLKNEMDREISHRRQINAGTKGELDALQSKANTLIRNVAFDIDKMDLGFNKYLK